MYRGVIQQGSTGSPKALPKVTCGVNYQKCSAGYAQDNGCELSKVAGARSERKHLQKCTDRAYLTSGVKLSC